MTTTGVPQQPFTWVRQLRPLVDSLKEEVPRAFLIGNAGSGKSTALRHLHELLRMLGREAHLQSNAMLAIEDVPAEQILLVDDFHLLDDQQRDHVRTRGSDPAAALVVAGRPWSPAHPTNSVAIALERQLSPIVLGHVSRADIFAALKTPEERPLDSCVEHIRAVTQGVAWLVHEAIALHDRADCVDDPSHTELDLALHESIAHHLARADSATRQLVEEVCVAPSVAAQAISNVVGDEAILRAHAEGLLLRNGLPVPIVRDAVCATMSFPRLVEFRALCAEGSAALTARRARMAWQLGDLDTAAALIDEASPAQSSRDLIDLHAAVWAERGLMAQANAVYELSPPQHDAGSLGRAAIAAFGVGRPLTLDQQRASEVPSAVNVSMDLLRRGLSASLSADTPNAVLPDLVRAAEMFTAARTTVPMCELPAVIAAVTALNLGALAAAHTILEDACEGSHGGAHARPRLLLWQAWVAAQQGYPDKARALLRQVQLLRPALPARDSFLQHAILVALARRYDDASDLQAAWRSARASILRTDVDIFLLHPLAELVSSATRVGDSDRMQPHLDRALQIVEALGNPPLWSTHLRWAGIQQGILLSSPERLAPHAKALVAISSHSQVASKMARAGRVWTSVLGGTVDADAVEIAARGLASVGLRWDAARLAGHGAARTTDRKTATRLLACARAMHPTDAVRRQSAAAAEVANVAVPEAEEVLSERELEVARLVLQGRTYAEIGEAIFISPRTAEHHIAHIRRRLGASTRSEMLEMLRSLMHADAPSPAMPPVQHQGFAQEPP